MIYVWQWEGTKAKGRLDSRVEFLIFLTPMIQSFPQCEGNCSKVHCMNLMAKAIAFKFHWPRLGKKKKARWTKEC